MNPTLRSACLLCVAGLGISQSQLAEAQPAVPLANAPAAGGSVAWLDGESFHQQLQLDASVLWQDAPLRERLNQFAAAQKVAIWLDRRIDPDQLMNLSVRSRPLEDVIRQIAKQLDCGMCVVDSVVYIGPQTTAHRLASAIERLDTDLKRVPVDTRAALSKRTKASWPMLTTPREALQQSLREASATLRWESLAAVPHDLLPEAQLPAMAVSDRLSLLLAGFDLSFTPSSPLTVIPLPAAEDLSRTYSVAKSLLPQFQQVIAAYPLAKVARQGARFRVEGPGEMHRRLRSALKPRKMAASKGPPVKRYSLKVSQQPVGGVARQLAAQLGLQLNVAPAAEGKLNARISFDVKEVTRDELIDAMLAPAGLRGEVANGALEVANRQ